MARKKSTLSTGRGAMPSPDPPFGGQAVHRLEVVVKGDVIGTTEAVTASVETVRAEYIEIRVIQDGVGPVSKSDLLMAQTGSRLVIGFNVDLAPKLAEQLGDFGVEVRLYDTIYRLTEDVQAIAQRLKPAEPEEKITAKAEVIAVFKGSHKGIIIGCEVKEGRLALGRHFRVITAMGPAYTGKIESLQVERAAVKSAKVGQQAGIGISGWNKAKVGDLVECFEIISPKDAGRWQPQARVLRLLSA
jgi:translation initiation factor IF-2